MGKTKKAGIIARAVTCLAATVAIALGTASPAFAAGEVTDSVDTSNISVTVPTTIPCTMMADGTVVAPSGLSIVNSGDAVVMDAYTADAMGNAVDFTLDIGGTRALSRTGGKDSAPASGIDFSSGSKELRLKVSKLDRKINAALMDKASSGGTDMLKLGFKFSEKALQGVVSISGDTTVGSTLTATTSNLQADAKPSYQWYRDGSVISGATGSTYTTIEEDDGHGITCKVSDSTGKYTGTLTSNAITPMKPAEAFAVYSADDNSLNFYKRSEVPNVGQVFEGRTATAVYTGIETDVYSTGNQQPWWDYSNDIRTVKFLDVVKPVSTAYWFFDCKFIKSLNLTNLDTSEVTNMEYMFCHIYDYIPSGNGSVFRALALDFSGFDTSNVTNMRGMFRDNHAVESLDLSGFDTSSVTDMSFMFHNMTRIQSLDVRSFDTSRVVNMEYMFKGLGSVLDKFKSLDLSSFDTSNVTNMKGMFDNNVCLELVTLGSRFRFITWGDGAGYLPRQTPDYIPGADGMWYNTAGQGFNPNVVPSYVADTYTAYNPALQRPVSLSESPV